ncbi:hypothetical protein VTL71DRAFT_13293 [Oculimacula yallundae]|uniref:Ankyrin repeat protein n=1 Tax=Oculimacula yallundae TaxID=86028 RepID=A0ABR4CJX6_9HELO
MASNIPEIADDSIGGRAEYSGEDFVPDEISKHSGDDCLIKYFRCRYADRASLMKSYSDGEQMKINRELSHIKNLREEFERQERHKPNIEMFLYRQALWRKSAIEECEGNREGLERKVQRWGWSRTLSKSNGDLQRRIFLENNILSAVETWVKPVEQRSPNVLRGAEKAAEEIKGQSQDSLTWLLQKFTRRFRKAQEQACHPPLPPTNETIDTSRDFILPKDSYQTSVPRITLRKSDAASPLSYLSYDIAEYALSEILAEGLDNPLTAKCEPNTIRYFHFPSNNMQWIEEAIARYYGEASPGKSDYSRHRNDRTKASNILCRQFWNGLQQGGLHDPVHARHMKSHCSLISPETEYGLETPHSNNFVVFMPYLHWETYERYKKMSQVMKMATEERNRNLPRVWGNRPELARIVNMVHLQQGDMSFLVSNAQKTTGKQSLFQSSKPKQRSPLGEYLLQIAKLYDALDIEPDIRILTDHLHKEPPLHARRTLSQSYLGKIPNTDARDENQVVYKATKAGKNFHKSPRMLMVDQLWLYVLDDNTIITSFPKRWGRASRDQSSIQQSIRDRLEHLREGEIQSVHDLALLIMDQCSTVFFDRSRPIDNRPELLNCFSDALSHVTGLKIVSSEIFWRQLDKLDFLEHQTTGFETTALKYLNIRSECELLREAHDIIEELRMMEKIFTEQLQVVDQFLRNMTDVKDIETKNFGHQREETMEEKILDSLQSIRQLLAERATRDDDHTAAPFDGIARSTELDGYDLSSAEGKLPVMTKTGMPIVSTGSSIPPSTFELAHRVRTKISNRRAELQELELDSVNLADELKDFLELKQQQAGIFEAEYALKRADETTTQGRSIMLFTIVTIIFLPLSFMSSVFGMNAKEFSDSEGNSSISLNRMFTLIFSISLGIVAISIVLAFSKTFFRVLLYLYGVFSGIKNVLRQLLIPTVEWKERRKLRKDWEMAKLLERRRMERELGSRLNDARSFQLRHMKAGEGAAGRGIDDHKNDDVKGNMFRRGVPKRNQRDLGRDNPV